MMTDVLVGFERTPDCVRFQPVEPAVNDENVAGMTVREALDRLIAIEPTYRWEERAGVAVIRPVVAWIDPADPLNLHADPISLTDTSLGVSLCAALNVKLLPNSSANALLARRLSIAFRGGALVDALNAIVRAHQNAGWYGGLEFRQGLVSLQSDQFQQFPLVSVQIATVDGSTVSVSTPLAHLQTRR
jgi:hypothetical protein